MYRSLYYVYNVIKIILYKKSRYILVIYMNLSYYMPYIYIYIHRNQNILENYALVILIGGEKYSIYQYRIHIYRRNEWTKQRYTVTIKLLV